MLSNFNTTKSDILSSRAHDNYYKGAGKVHLDRTSRKVRCPQCGRKTFVNYVDADGRAVADGVCGKCDRLDKCAYHCPPRVYFAERESPMSPSRHVERPRRQLPRKRSFALPQRMLDATLATPRNSNRLAQFIHSLFDRHLGTTVVDEVLDEYKLGTMPDGSACFWQLDPHGRICTGKIINYDAATGKRIHGDGAVKWMHSDYKRTHPEFELRQAYFGSHLLGQPDAANRPVWLMESEKAALIVAVWLRWRWEEACPPIVLSTGGCEGFNPTLEALAEPMNKHAVLRDKIIALFPDGGKHDEWQQRGLRLEGFASGVWMADIMEQPRDVEGVINPECEVNPGDGFDDILIRYLTTGNLEGTRSPHLATADPIIYDYARV